MKNSVPWLTVAVLAVWIAAGVWHERIDAKHVAAMRGDFEVAAEDMARCEARSPSCACLDEAAFAVRILERVVVHRGSTVRQREGAVDGMRRLYAFAAGCRR